MSVKSVSVVKHPVDQVWSGMRDDLPNLVDLLEDITGITVEAYEKVPPNIVNVVNIWKTTPNLPAIVTKYLKTDTFAWTDRAQWNNDQLECTWSIEPHIFQDIIQCAGTTQFAPAMGGRGTRVTFNSDIKLKSKGLAGVPTFLEDAVVKAVEAFIKTLIPKNFRKIIDALSTHLDAKKVQKN